MSATAARGNLATAPVSAAFYAALAMSGLLRVSAVPFLAVQPLYEAFAADSVTTCGDASAEVAQALRRYRGRVIVLGETHGTREVPALVAELACHLSDGARVLVGIELPHWLNENIAAFVGGRIGDETFLADDYWRSPMQDGRQSRAMVEMLRHLRGITAGGRQIDVLGFDDAEVYFEGKSAPQATRDELMASNVLRFQREGAYDFVLTLVGSAHARRAVPPSRTMADHLPRDETLTVAIGFLRGGEAWTCGSGRCGIGPVPSRGDRPVLRLTRLEQGPYDAELVLPEATASPPATEVRSVDRRGGGAS